MEIVSLNPAFEPIFWKHVNQDIPHYFFFAFDWKNNKDETDTLLAITGRRIDGMMLVYKKSHKTASGTFRSGRSRTASPKGA